MAQLCAILEPMPSKMQRKRKQERRRKQPRGTFQARMRNVLEPGAPSALPLRQL
jgi:hypothetical protein